jgi:3-hydroxyisobutyrate dehydrogenase-like beta-hydroxyacid dehydrogenase
MSRSVASPAELGEASDLVGVCVWDEHDVDEVLLGKSGVLAGLAPGGAVVIHSTISPAACLRLAEDANRRNVSMLDAPVSVGSNVPKLLVLVGGDQETVTRCQPVLDSIGDPVVHLGPLGSGQIAKLVNNTLLAATVGLAEDALRLGAELGLDPVALIDALSAASSRGTWTSLLGPQIRGTSLSTGGRTHEWATKDVGLTEAIAAKARTAAGQEVLRLARLGALTLG